MSLSTLLTSNQTGFRKESVGGFSSADASSDLYTAFSSSFTGAWWYLRGDGTNMAGAPTALSSVGSPVANTVPVFSGFVGADLSSQWLPGVTSNGYRTAAVASPAGSFSVGVLFMADAAAASHIVAKDVGGSSQRCVALTVNNDGAGSIAAIIFKTDGSFTSLVSATGLVVPRALNLAILTYEFVADGSSKVRVYINGSAAVISSDVAVGPVQAASSRWTVGYREAADLPFLGNVVAAFYTESVLSSTTVGQMMTAALDQVVTTGKGATPTFTRATVASAPRSDAKIMRSRSGIVRPVGGGVLIEASTTNLVPYSDDLSFWSNFNGGGPGATTATASYAYSPDGSKTVTRLQLSAVNGAGKYQFRYISVAPSNGSTYTTSFWARATSGTATLPVYVYKGSGYTTVQTFALTETWARYQLTPWVAQAGSAQIRFGNDFDAAGGIATVASDSLITCVQTELGTLATSPILTTGSALARNADIFRVSATGWPTSAGNIEFDFTNPHPITPTDCHFMDSGPGAGGVNVRLASGAVVLFTGSSGSGTGGLSTTSGAQTWTQNQTYRVRVSWGGGSHRIFRDGVLLASSTGKNMPDTHSANPAFIGCLSSGLGQLNGTIANFRVYRDT